MEFRRYGARINWGGLLTPSIKLLLIVNAAVFLVRTLVALIWGPETEFAVLVMSFGLVPRGVTHGLRVWQPFTYLFLHGGIFHLLVNMLGLWMFGADLERTWGRRRFLFYYFLTGVGAGVLNIVVKTIVDPAGLGSARIPTIGASGAVYGILLAAALMFPQRQIWLIPFPVTIPMKVYVLIIGAIAFYGSLDPRGDTISHITHLGGILVGYVYLRRGSFLYRVRNSISDWKRRRLRRKFEVYMRQHKEEPPSRPDHWVN